MNESLMIDVKQVAKLLGISSRTVWAMAGDGRLPPPIRLGGLRRWSRATVEQWVAQKAEEASKALCGGADR